MKGSLISLLFFVLSFGLVFGEIVTMTRNQVEIVVDTNENQPGCYCDYNLDLGPLKEYRKKTHCKSRRNDFFKCKHDGCDWNCP